MIPQIIARGADEMKVLMDKNLNYLVMNKIFNFMNNKNKWSIIINALLTAITGILTAYGIL